MKSITADPYVERFGEKIMVRFPQGNIFFKPEGKGYRFEKREGFEALSQEELVAKKAEAKKALRGYVRLRRRGQALLPRLQFGRVR